MRRIPHGIFLAFFLILAAFPTSASALTSTAATEENCGTATINEWGSGQMDANGMLYLPCSQPIGSTRFASQGDNRRFIAVIDASGAMVNAIPITFGDGYVRTASDVAPSPDGRYLYVMRYDDFKVYRFDRQANGSYAVNPAWGLANFPGANGAGSYLPRGVFIATDGNGDIYLSAGLWASGAASTDNAVVKYHADGSFVTRFGRQVNGSWALGESHGAWGGVTATADGRRVFVTDINNSRVQRFDIQADGSYRAVLALGMNQYTDPNRWGACYQDGVLGAPYDVTLSPKGEVLVVNTTCYNDDNDGDGTPRYAAFPLNSIEVQRYGQDGSVRGSVMAVSKGFNRAHSIAVDRGGSIHLVAGKIQIRPFAGYSDEGAAAGGTGPMGGTAAPADVTAPTLRSVTTPGKTRLQTVTMTVDAVDDRGVVEMRVRADGVQGDWQPYKASFQQAIGDRAGEHTVTVQVRDVAGNVSAEVSATIYSAECFDCGQNERPIDALKPKITKVSMPVQMQRSARSMKVAVTATDNVRATMVRFSSADGKWGAWQSIKGARVVKLAARDGWHGLLVQARDAAGNRSTPWFQPVLVAPKNTQWAKGTSGVDSKRFGAGTQHVDFSNFDKKVDRVRCGGGYDTVLAQPEDIVASDCERVVRIKLPAF